MQVENHSADSIRLSVPAAPKYARVVRMLAANVATIEGMDVNEVEDMRMVAEEAFIYSCSTGLKDKLDVEIGLGQDGITLDFALGPDPVTESTAENSLVYSACILEAMCDECVIGGPEGVLHLYKAFGDADGIR